MTDFRSFGKLHRMLGHGPGLDSDVASVGRLMWIAITARDMYGNPRTTGGDRFALSLDGPNGTRLAASWAQDAAPPRRRRLLWRAYGTRRRTLSNCAWRMCPWA